MGFRPAAELIGSALSGGYAVPSFCVWDAESAEAVLRAAVRLDAPVLVMAGPGEFPLLTPASLAAAARTALERYPAVAALHLDHGDTPALAAECIEAGFTSVMLDYSTRPFDENVAAVGEVARLAHARGVSVEGELGAVGKVDNATAEGSSGSSLTDPRQAARYVERTGVDMLAVSIGNAHGIYAVRPRLDFARLEAIGAAAGVPLVLHGGSGTPPEDLKRAVELGIAKVNVASELVRAVRESLQQQWAGAPAWLPGQIARAMGAMEAVAARWIGLCGAAGKA